MEFVWLLLFFFLQLRVSNFSGDFVALPDVLCDPDNVKTFNITLVYSSSSISVDVSGDSVILAPVSAIEESTLTLGNVPRKCIHFCVYLWYFMWNVFSS